MKTLHVDLGLDWRGGQAQVLLLMEGLRARDHQAELLAVEGSPLAVRSKEAGVMVHAVKRRACRTRAALLLRKHLSDNGTDIIHAHDAHALTAAWFAGVNKNCALVVSRRVAFPLQTNRLALARYRSADRILAVSGFVAEQLSQAGLDSSKVEVVYDGVEVPEPSAAHQRDSARAHWKLKEQQPVIGCLGALEPGKGHELLLRALPKLQSQFPGLFLLLAGKGSLKAKLQSLAEELQVQDRVAFHDVPGDLSLFYSALDAFVFPSVQEGLGTALLMAMAHGLPSAAFAGGANAEIIETGRNGMLAGQSTPEALAEAIAETLGETEFSRSAGAAARETIVQRFTAKCMVARTLEVYRQLLQKGVAA